MRLKSFFANTLEQAMRAAKIEFGEEAMLVDSKLATGESRGFGRLEVVFAYPSTAGKQSVAGKQSFDGKQAAEGKPNPTGKPTPATGGNRAEPDAMEDAGLQKAGSPEVEAAASGSSARLAVPKETGRNNRTSLTTLFGGNSPASFAEDTAEEKRKRQQEQLAELAKQAAAKEQVQLQMEYLRSRTRAELGIPPPKPNWQLETELLGPLAGSKANPNSDLAEWVERRPARGQGARTDARTEHRSVAGRGEEPGLGNSEGGEVAASRGGEKQRGAEPGTGLFSPRPEQRKALAEPGNSWAGLAKAQLADNVAPVAAQLSAPISFDPAERINRATEQSTSPDLVVEATLAEFFAAKRDGQRASSTNRAGAPSATGRAQANPAKSKAGYPSGMEISAVKALRAELLGLSEQLGNPVRIQASSLSRKWDCLEAEDHLQESLRHLAFSEAHVHQILRHCRAAETPDRFSVAKALGKVLQGIRFAKGEDALPPEAGGISWMKSVELSAMSALAPENANHPRLEHHAPRMTHGATGNNLAATQEFEQAAVDSLQRLVKLREQEEISWERNTARITGLGSVDRAPADGLRIVSMLGPSGAGKSSMLLKLAVQEGIAKGRPVLLAHVEGTQLTNTPTLRRLAELAGIDFREFQSPLAIVPFLEQYRHPGLLLLDLPSVAPSDEWLAREIASALDHFPSLERHLVLPANLEIEALEECFRRFAPFHPTHLSPTRLDETKKFGPLCSLLWTSKLPLAYCSTGWSIPEDLVLASPQLLAERLTAGLRSAGLDRSAPVERERAAQVGR